MGEERLMFRWCLVCVVSFLVAIRIISQGYIICDDLAIDSSLLVVKNIKIM